MNLKIRQQRKLLQIVEKCTFDKNDRNKRFSANGGLRKQQFIGIGTNRNPHVYYRSPHLSRLHCSNTDNLRSAHCLTAQFFRQLKQLRMARSTSKTTWLRMKNSLTLRTFEQGYQGSSVLPLNQRQAGYVKVVYRYSRKLKGRTL